jgi:enoyl-CoA hydratase
MSEEFVKIERGLGPDGRIAVVRFDRGGVNPMSMAALRALRAAARSFEDDLETSVVILTGNAKAFTAGFDLKDSETYHRQTLPMGERRHLLRLGPTMCRAWEQMDQVTIAAIEGHCIGGGVALSVSLDFRFCGRSAHFRVPEIGLGMNMSWGSMPRLLVEKVVDDGQALSAAMEFAARIAEQPPIPVRMTKRSVNALATALDDLAAHMDHDQYALANLTDDFKEGVSAFRERRKPKFRGS